MRETGVIHIFEYTTIRSNGEILLPSYLLSLLNAGFYAGLNQVHGEAEALLPEEYRRGRFILGMTFINCARERVAVSVWENISSYSAVSELAPLLERLFNRRADARYSRTES